MLVDTLFGVMVALVGGVALCWVLVGGCGGENEFRCDMPLRSCPNWSVELGKLNCTVFPGLALVTCGWDC